MRPSPYGGSRKAILDRSPRVAFTLIELLVCIAIIAILASLLLPVLGRAKLKSQGLTCMNNSKQLLLAWSLYADDNSSRLPLAYPGAGSKDAPWVGHTNYVFKPELGALAQYTRSASVYLCPGSRSTNPITHGMNQYVGGIYPDEYAADYPLLVCQKMEQTAGLFVFADQREDYNQGPVVLTFAEAQFWNPPNFCFRTVPASYHNRSGVFSFSDGHAEIHRWKDDRTLPPLKYPNYGIESPHNYDSLWVLERATKLRR